MDTEFLTVMEEIVASIKQAGYDPREQLSGYIATGRGEYITRNGNAREKIKKLNLQHINDYVNQMTNS